MAAGRLPDGGRRKIGGTDFCVSCGKPYIITAPAQSRFAEYLGLDVSTVSKWCSGKIVCRPYIIAMAAKILSLAADDVRGDAEKCKNEEEPT